MGKIKHKIKNAFSLLQGKHIFLYLVFVVISAIFWILLTLNNVAQNEYKVPLIINSVPKDVELVSNNNQIIKVSVKEKGTSSIKNLFLSAPEIHIDFKDFDQKNGNIKINNTDLKRLISNEFQDNSSIISIRPDSLNIRYKNVKSSEN